MSCHSHTGMRKITSDTGNNKVKLLFGLIAASFIMWCEFHFLCVIHVTVVLNSFQCHAKAV